MAVGDTDAAADAHMQEGVAAAGDILRNDFAAVGEDSHRLEEVGQGVTDADVVHTRHEVQKGPEEEVDPGEAAEAEDFPLQLENPVETAVAAGEDQPVGKAEDPRAVAAVVGLHWHFEGRAVRWSVVEALRVAWEASQKAQVEEQLHW